MKTGNRIPSFTLPDQNGNEINIDSYLGKGPLVIYFYPKNETTVCTKEACSFRDAYESFTDVGAEVIGISADTVDSHKNFAANHRLPFVLLSDQKNKVRSLFGVPKSMLGLLPGRVTYVIDKNGLVRHIFNAQLASQKHVDEALNIIRSLNDD